jgi:signal transduction histidine kinase
MARLAGFFLRAVLLLLLALAARAQAPGTALALDPLPDDLALVHGELSWLRDPGGTLSLADVQAHVGAFRPVRENFTIGFTDDVYWLRLPVQVQAAPADWWLDLRPPSLDDIRLYLVQPDGSIYQRHTGALQPLSSRDASYGNFLLRLHLPPGQSTLYLRLRTSGSMTVIARLQRVGSFPVAATHQYLQAGFYLGMIITVVLLSVVYVAIWRGQLYAVYLGYLLCQLALALSSYGLFSQYLLPGHPVLSARMGGVSFSLTVVFGMLFFARLLDLHKGGGWRLRVFQGVAVVGTLSAIATLFGAFGHFAMPLLLSMHLAVLVSLATLASRLARGSLQDRMFALSFVGYIAFISSATLRGAGSLPVTELGLMVGKAGNGMHLLLLQLTVMLRSRTAEREMVRARQESEQQQRVVAEQEQFLAMITHEIRTPLSVISAATESLGMIDPGAQRPERAQRYERISQAVRRVDHLLNLAVSRDRLDEAPAGAPVKVDLVALTRLLVDQLEPEQRQRTHLHCSHEALYVLAQTALLQFSLLNLIDNACKYSPPTSPILIDIHLTAGGQLSWSIHDQGPGVCPEDRTRIFEKYFRSAEHSGTPGLGLGLYIAHRLVGRLGGQISYHDEQPGGACFEVKLPLAA